MTEQLVYAFLLGFATGWILGVVIIPFLIDAIGFPRHRGP